MSRNLNDAIKRNQIALLIAGLFTAGAAVGGIWYISEQNSKPTNTAPAPAPQMTGVVAQDLTKQMAAASLQAQQDKTNSLEDKLEKITNALKETNNTLTTQNQRLEESATKSRQLEQDLNSLKELQKNGQVNQNNSLPATDSKGTPLPGALTGKNVGNPNAFYNFNNPNMNMGSVPQPVIHTLPPLNGHTYQTRTVKKKNQLPYIPSGSFAEAIMIEGADANASVTGQQNTSPVEFRLRGKLVMPNDDVFDLNGCFVTGEIFGDISSERGEVRTRKLSCKLKKGTIDMDLAGHVAYQGKEGIRGRPIMRNGKIIAYAAGAGVISGVGSGISQASTPVVGLGGSASMSGTDIAKAGLGGGAQKTGETLSDYWIKRAEQYHPVIEIGAGNLVTVVFQDGFQMKTIEEITAEKEEKEAKNQPQPTSTPVQSNGAVATAPTPAPAGIPDPNEVMRQAKQLQMGQSIN